MKARLALLIIAITPVVAIDRARIVPGFFFGNASQTDSETSFNMETPGLKATFRNEGVVYRIHGVETELRFIGADPRVKMEPAEPMTGKLHILVGKDARAWKTNVTIYQKLTYKDLYPGIDLSYSASGGQAKADFLVKSHADPAQIRLSYPTARRVWIDSNGDLVISDAAGELRERAPVVYQTRASERIEIQGRYRLVDEHTAEFEIGDYDRARTLVIDPVVSYSTFFGGGMTGAVTGVATDGTGSVYVTGWTESIDFPIAGAVQAVNRGGVDAFVAKLSADGTSIVYASYIGGSSDDRATAIAVDSSGQAYVTGSTASYNFPAVSPVRSGLNGGRDAFALKLNSTGNGFVYSTYLGGSGWDQGTAIAVDTSGNAYIAGDTQSVDFPTASAAQGSFGGQMDVFVTKLTPNGTIAYSTFLGGAAGEHAGGIAVDASGSAYVAGGTYSTNFPVVNAIQPSNGGGQDAFIAKINPSGSSFAFSTYFGGSSVGQSILEQANAIAIDASGGVYVTGVTNSTNFPVTSGALRTTSNGVGDAFVIKLNSFGTTLSYGTYLGGSTSNWAAGITVDSAGNAYVVGSTSSIDFPQVNTLQGFAGGYDAFVCQLNPSGTALVYSTMYGGSGSEAANAIAIDAVGRVYVGGQTNSFDFPLRTPLRSSYTGFATGFVMSLGSTAMPPANLATGKPATQSSIYVGNVAARAVDGNTDGVYWDSSLTHTNLDPNAWWQVDLGSSAAINSVVIWNRTDCCGDRLNDYWIFVSNTPFGPSDTPANVQARVGTFSSHQTVAPNPSATVSFSGVQGRYIRVQLSGTNYLSLAEVQVFGTLIEGTTNLAGGKAATQSSTLAAASLAVDGNTDGMYFHGSVTHTYQEANAWWQVDLGSSAAISSVAIWNRTDDCCGDRLSDYWIFVSNTPFGPSDTPANLQSRLGTFSSHQTVAPNPSSTISLSGVQGRYIRVQLSGTNYLSLAEVQVFGTLIGGTTNLASGKAASQSSTLAAACLAVDGNTDGAYFDGSVTHTYQDANAWWQVDLGSSAAISSVVIWNRTDDCCGDRLSDYWIFVSNTPFGPADSPATLQSRAGTWASHQTTAPSPSSTIGVGGVQGRYVRVQLSATNYLSLAEVQVY